jgi:hypothetical protein
MVSVSRLHSGEWENINKNNATYEPITIKTVGKWTDIQSHSNNILQSINNLQNDFLCSKKTIDRDLEMII